MTGSDFYSGSALAGAGGGAASGAMIGSQIAPVYGTLIGGLAGGALGLFGGASANSQRNKAVANQQKNLQQIMANMRAMSSRNYSNYMAGLKKAQAFYAPAMERWNYLYGTGAGTGNFDTDAIG